MNNKGQFANHIIVFIVGLTIISLVLLFGYSVIQGFEQDRCEVQRLTFATNLDNAIDRNKNWGTNRVVDLQPPCQTQQVCFVDRRIIDGNFTTERTLLESFTQPISDPSVANTINQSIWINEEVPAGAQRDNTNVFTVSPDGDVLPLEQYSTQAAALRVEDGSGDASALCIDLQQSRLRMRLQGDGTRARVVEEDMSGS